MTLHRPVLRRLVLASTVVASAAVALPSPSAAPSAPDWMRAATQAAWRQFGDPSYAPPPVPTPTNRASGWTPQPAGTTQTLNLDFGPYAVTPGSDVSRVDFTPAAATGYTTEVHTLVLNADGTKVPGDEVHTHHVHLLEADPNNPDYLDWL